MLECNQSVVNAIRRLHSIQPRQMALNTKVIIMAKTVHSTRSATRATRAKPAQIAPILSLLVQAVRPVRPVGESVSSAQAAALASVKLYVTAGKR